MAELSAEEQQAASAIADAIREGGGADRRGFGDIKDLFCANWEMVKKLLEFLLPYLPAGIKKAVEALIRIGDWVKGMICPG